MKDHKVVNYQVHKLYIKKKKDTLTINLLFKINDTNKKTLIWIPGFNDYYYHYYFGNKIFKSGIDLWIINFNNFGPSLKENNTSPLYINSFSDLIIQLKKTIEFINNKKKYDKKYIYGHSLGGLVAIMYCNKYEDNDIQGLILNSPLLMYTQLSRFNNLITSLFAILLKILGNIPIINNIKINMNNNNEYHDLINVNNTLDDNMFIKESFITVHSIKELINQCNLIKYKKVNIDIPILIMHSNKTSKDILNNPGDHVFNIKDYEYYSRIIGSNISIQKINGALHDVLVFSPKMSDTCFDIIFKWINM